MTKTVKSSAISVIGLLFGTKRSWHQALPLARTSARRVSAPASNGMPR